MPLPNRLMIHGSFLRGLDVSSPPQHLTDNIFLDRGLDYISLVYKVVETQVHNGQPKTGVGPKCFMPNLS